MPLNPGAPDILPAPGPPTFTQAAVGAGATIVYSLVAVNAAGQDSPPSAGVSVPNNAATPNNTLNWVGMPGVYWWKILKAGALLATVPGGVFTYTDSVGAAGTTYVATTAPAPNVQENSLLDGGGGKAAYSFAIFGVVPAATPTDVFCLTGSATKIGRLTRLIISGLQTTAGNIDVRVIKRSGGGPQSAGTAMTMVPHDSNDPAATMVAQYYTANPGTLGTAVGDIFDGKLFVPAAASLASPDKLILDFGTRAAKALVLRGILQWICINLNSVTLTGGLLNIYGECTEE